MTPQDNLENWPVYTIHNYYADVNYPPGYFNSVEKEPRVKVSPYAKFDKFHKKSKRKK